MWSRTDVIDPINIFLSRDGGQQYTEQIGSNVSGSSFTWTPSGSATLTAKLRIQSASNPSVSATSPLFVLVQPQITLNYIVIKQSFIG